jgi:hypothetical protein
VNGACSQVRKERLLVFGALFEILERDVAERLVVQVALGLFDRKVDAVVPEAEKMLKQHIGVV